MPSRSGSTARSASRTFNSRPSRASGHRAASGSSKHLVHARGRRRVRRASVSRDHGVRRARSRRAARGRARRLRRGRARHDRSCGRRFLCRDLDGHRRARSVAQLVRRSRLRGVRPTLGFGSRRPPRRPAGTPTEHSHRSSRCAGSPRSVGRSQVRPCLAIVLRLEWRIRYYDERGGQPLMDGIVHGTQELRPLVGVAWRPRW